MNKLWIIGILAVLGSCSKAPKCWGDDKIKGEIIRPFEFEGIMYWSNIESEKLYVIREEADFYEFLDSADVNPSAVNFNTESVIGYSTPAGGGEFKVKKNLEIDHDKKKYVYKLKVNACGNQDKLALFHNFVVVPKIPEDYTVEIEPKLKI